MKKKIVIRLICFMIILSFVFCNNVVYAARASSLTGIFTGDGGVNVSTGQNMITTIVGIVLSAVRIVAVGLSVVILTFLGIKYMSAAPSEKAEIKRQLITFTIGFIVFVSSTYLVKLIRTYAENLSKGK